MKKSILFLATLAVIVSCKKKDEDSTFEPTDVSGTMVLKGNVSKNVITPNGSGSWTNFTRIPAASVAVTVKVNKNSLYPNSTAQGADVYSGVSDANGNYAITIRANATGVSGQITVDGFTGTQDTLVNGVTKPGLLSTYQGTSINRTLFMGQNSQFDYNFNAVNVSTNPNVILKTGTALITGSVGVNLIKEIATGTLISLTTTYVPVASRKVYLNFSNDPNTLAMKSYEAVTDANGYYSFTINTVASGTSGFNQNATIWVADYSTTRDTVRPNNTLKTGPAGVFQKQTLFEGGIYNNDIRNANHFYYNAFTPN